jgi:predicted kinase
VLDWGFWSRTERDDYRTRAAALGLRTELRFLDVPLEELVNRLELRIRDPRPTSFPVSEAELRQWWEAFEPPTADELKP